jgi:hypothetical protein
MPPLVALALCYAAARLHDRDPWPLVGLVALRFVGLAGLCVPVEQGDRFFAELARRWRGRRLPGANIGATVSLPAVSGRREDGRSAW